MDRFADNCGWAKDFADESFFCAKKKWHLINADKGIFLCPCQFWIKKTEKKPKKAEVPPKSLF